MNLQKIFEKDTGQEIGIAKIGQGRSYSENYVHWLETQFLQQRAEYLGVGSFLKKINITLGGD